MRRRISVATALALLLTCVSTLVAQGGKKDADSNTRTLQGAVLDAGGNPVPQAVVQLKDTRTLQVLSFIAKDDGSYHFANLKNDIEYEVKAVHGGLETAWKRVSVFDTRKVIVLNLHLEKKP